MKTYVGMSYDQWREANNVKSDEQRESERNAWHRSASEGMIGYPNNPWSEIESERS